MTNPRGKNVVLMLTNAAQSGKLILPAGTWRVTMVPSGNFTGTPLAFVVYDSDASATNKGPAVATPGQCAGVNGGPLTPPYPADITVCEADRDCTQVQMLGQIALGESVAIVASEAGSCGPRCRC